VKKRSNRTEKAVDSPKSAKEEKDEERWLDGTG
jgi:hypothetical protein